MKPIHLFLTFAAALAPSALPAAAPIFATGDLLMGFRATAGDGSGSCYVVNIGPAATYRDATAPVIRNVAEIGNIKADLDTNFNTGWFTRDDVFWGIAGCPSNNAAVGNDPEDTLYASRAEAVAGTPNTAWDINSPTTRGNIATRMIAMVVGPGSFQDTSVYQATGNSAWAVIQSASANNSWRYFMAPGGGGAPSNLDFGGFSNIEATPDESLSLFRMVDENGSSYEGHFTLSSAGVLTFTPNVSLNYATWAATNAGGQVQNLDFDGDGLANGVEFFMGTPGNAFTQGPHLSGNSITWPRASGRDVTSFGVQVSTDLVSWNTPVSGVAISGSQVVYTVPSGLSSYFVRLIVTP